MLFKRQASTSSSALIMYVQLAPYLFENNLMFSSSGNRKVCRESRRSDDDDGDARGNDSTARPAPPCHASPLPLLPRHFFESTRTRDSSARIIRVARLAPAIDVSTMLLPSIYQSAAGRYFLLRLLNSISLSSLDSVILPWTRSSSSCSAA